MTTERDLVRLLKQHDQKLGEVPIRLSADLRIRRSLRTTTPRRFRRGPLIGWATAMLAAGLAITLWFGRSPDDAVEAIHLPVASADPVPCTLRSLDATRVEYQGRCQVHDGDVTIQSEARSRLVRATNEWFVLEGRCRFSVEPKPPGASPLRVHVGGGTIEVTGTEFDVEQGEQGGNVVLHSGRIRFVASGQPPVHLEPGQRWIWLNSPVSIPSQKVPEEPPPAQANTNAASEHPPPTLRPLPSPTERTAAPTPANDLEQTVEQVVRLRALGRYRDALQLLAQVSQTSQSVHTREVLSYERGTLLERLGDTASSCRHWTRHMEQFPQGRYRVQVTSKLAENCRKVTSPASSAGPGPASSTPK